MMIVFEKQMEGKKEEEIVRLLRQFAKLDDDRFAVEFCGEMVVVRTIKKGKHRGFVVESVVPVL